MNPVKSARLAPGADPQGKPEKFKIYSPTEYKKISIPKPCFCGTCGSLTDEQLNKIYSSNLIISENNPLVFTFFGRDLTK
jgi:hypothetical protein